jgi:hypothetical protein
VVFSDDLEPMRVNRAEYVEVVKVLRPNTFISILGKPFEDGMYNLPLNLKTGFHTSDRHEAVRPVSHLGQ